MGTGPEIFDRNSPANRDCLDKARPGEPMFILLGRDPDAATIVREWAGRRSAAATRAGLIEQEAEHLQPVFALADAMEAYASEPENAPATAPPADAYQGPPTAAAGHFAQRVILSELACRLFRTLVLGNIIIADSPAAMDWLRDWIDGNLEGHGPMGSGPMIWPERLPAVCTLLRGWGFQPTPTLPPYVTRQPQPVINGSGQPS